VEKLLKLFRVIRTLRNWPTYVFDYLKLIPRGEVVYELRNGTRFNLQAHTYEAVALAEVWMEDVYTPKGDELGSDSIVVDVGANVGLFTVLAGQIATRGRVFAFEPMPDNFSHLQRNVALNGLNNVEAIEAALAGTTEERDLFVGATDTVSHSLNMGWAGTTPIRVKCYALLDAMRRWRIQRIDFLKVDVEAAEMEVFAKCPEEVFRAIRKLSMEVHEWPGSDNTSIFRKMFESRQFHVEASSTGFVATNTLSIVPLPR